MTLQFPKLAEHFSHGMSKKAYQPTFDLYGMWKSLGNAYNGGLTAIRSSGNAMNIASNIQNSVDSKVPVAPTYVGKSGVIPFMKSVAHASGVTDYIPYANTRGWNSGFGNGSEFNNGLAANRNTAKADLLARFGFPTMSTARKGMATNAAAQTKALNQSIGSPKFKTYPKAAPSRPVQSPGVTGQVSSPVKPKYTPILKYASLQQSDLKWIGKLLGE